MSAYAHGFSLSPFYTGRNEALLQKSTISENRTQRKLCDAVSEKLSAVVCKKIYAITPPPRHTLSRYSTAYCPGVGAHWPSLNSSVALAFAASAGT